MYMLQGFFTREVFTGNQLVSRLPDLRCIGT